jgi:hypothetical protein
MSDDFPDRPKGMHWRPSRPGEFHPEPLTDSGLVGIEIRRAQL